MNNLITRVPNYMQIYFPYNAVTSACEAIFFCPGILTLSIRLEIYATLLNKTLF